MSIHRIFGILDSTFTENQKICQMFDELIKKFKISIINLNWDIVTEHYLHTKDFPYTYGIDIVDLNPSVNKETQIEENIPLLKIHGSSNWLYCDRCRQLFTARFGGKIALYKRVYLDKDDFEIFGGNNVSDKLRYSQEEKKCRFCGNLMSGRLVTFSFQKEYALPQFQTIWEKAFSELRRAEKWLFIGYSLPDADYEFKHMLKSAQLARNNNPWKAKVVLKEDKDAEKRYKRFFGEIEVFQGGTEEWINRKMTNC